MINKKDRDMKIFRRMSRYIMQQDIHQKGLTVRDIMIYAADLKLGFSDLKREQKNDLIEEIIKLLRLEKAINTDSSLLSGGEKKRLSIAQELVNNPPILFLDEPTTGLDDMSSWQCIELLKRLAEGGRTVICSIHTPSAKLFEMFDHVYIVANGQCVYQGEGKNIVPYMETVGLRCPKTYNPADFGE
jgi:ABC-type multidrug transport system ATPase subunit